MTNRYTPHDRALNLCQHPLAITTLSALSRTPAHPTALQAALAEPPPGSTVTRLLPQLVNNGLAAPIGTDDERYALTAKGQRVLHHLESFLRLVEQWADTQAPHGATAPQRGTTP